MPRLYLVRHGRAAAGFGDDLDPGLDDVGRADAESVADRLAGRGPLPILVSPLRRTRETAAPLAARWTVEPEVSAEVGEIPSPTDDLAERAAWLRPVLGSTWTALGAELLAWRAQLLGRLQACDADTVVVTHFVAINAVLGAAADDDRVVQAVVANGSCTVVDCDGGFRVVEVGQQADSAVW